MRVQSDTCVSFACLLRTIILYLLCSVTFVSFPAVSGAEESGNTREDAVLGTFTEGMQTGTDEETGDTVIRSAPSEKEQKQPEQPPIYIQISPEVKVPEKE